MKVTINGNLFVDGSLDYDRIHQAVQDNTYNSIGEAITSKISDYIHHAEWFRYTPKKFDLVQNFDHVQAICGNNQICYMDSLNWSIMNKNELTADIYKFIAERTAVMREGILHNFTHNHFDLHTILDLIDWHFILDCISWFF